MLSIGRQTLFYSIVLLLPTQFGRHFWPAFSYVLGIRVDYLSPTLYVTDLIIFALFVLWIFSARKSNLKNQISKIALGYWKLVVFLAIGILFSKSLASGLYGLVKFLEFLFFGLYTASHFKDLRKETVLILFSVGIIFESLLAIFQFSNHGSLQGIFYFFGERMFTSQTPGIANASLGGALVLRPYGTFPHPNVLAGYLLVAMALVIFNIKQQTVKIWKVFCLISVAFGTIAIFLTLSRVAIVLWLAILGYTLLRSRGKFFIFHLSFIIFVLGLATPLGLRFSDIKLSDETLVQRGVLTKDSLTMIKDHPIFGVGLYNFLISLPLYAKLQPVHNIFLLVLSETGIIGFGFFIWFILKTYKRILSKKSLASHFSLLILSSVLVLGMFDHYFLTLQQGQLLFCFILGLCWAPREVWQK